MSQITTEEKQRSWLVQLQKEHASICWQYKVNLSKPLFELSSGKSNIGQWSPETRTIKMSKQFIEDHSWNDVVQVLKHEMAHQIVHEIFRQHDQHGERFVQASKMVGLEEQYCKATGYFAEVDQLSDSTPSPLFSRIEKLFALAQSENEYEAGLAMQKANELMTKYNLNFDSQMNNCYSVQVIYLHRKRLEKYHRKICLLLMDYFYVEVVISNQFDAQKCDEFRTIDLIGRAHNAEIAEYVFYFLIRKLDELWNRYVCGNGRSIKVKNSFWLGVLQGFSEKLSRQQNKIATKYFKTKHVENLALTICKQDLGLQKIVRQRYPRLQKRSGRNHLVDRTVYQDGKKEGNKITIHKSIYKKGTEKGKMIPVYNFLK